MTQLSVKQAGAFVKAAPFVKTAGTWKRAEKICIKLSGQWICDFSSIRSCGLYEHVSANIVKFNYGTATATVVGPNNTATREKIEFPVLSKDVGVAFAKGDNNGSMIDIAPVANHYINMWLVVETATGDLDYMTQAGPDLTPPAGWQEVTYIGAVFWSSKLEPFVTQIENGQLRMKLVNRWENGSIHAGSGNVKGQNGGASFDATPYIPPQIWGVYNGIRKSCKQTPGYGVNCAQYLNNSHGLIDGVKYPGPIDTRNLDLTKGSLYAQGWPAGWYHVYFGIADYIIQESDCDPTIIKGDFFYTNPSGETIHFPTGLAEPPSGNINLPELSKDISLPWAAGDNVGGLVGSVKDNHWVLLLAITDAAKTAVDYMATSTLPVTAPAGWTIICTVGMVYRTTSIIPFTVSTQDKRCLVTFTPPLDLGKTVTAPGGHIAASVPTDLSTYVPPTPHIYRMTDASARSCGQIAGQVDCRFYIGSFGAFSGDARFRSVGQNEYAFLNGSDLTKVTCGGMSNHTGSYTAQIKIGSVAINR